MFRNPFRRGGDVPAPPPPEGEAPERTSPRDLLLTVAVALVVALLVRGLVVQAYKIPTPSMVPTLLVGDHVLVNKFVYGWKLPFLEERVFPFWEPQRGDVLVFRYPADRKVDFIKRVVAVEGDVVEVREKRLFLNGEAAADPHAMFSDYEESLQGRARDNYGPFTVPPGHVFVMGDNRDNSRDSRFWGPVPVADIRGKAMVIYWSADLSKPLLSSLRWPWKGDGPNYVLYVPRLDRVGKVVE